MEWIGLVGVVAVAVAVVQTVVSVAAKREARAAAAAAERSAVASSGAADRAAEYLGQMVELMRPDPWRAEPRTDQQGRSFQFRNTSGRVLHQVQIHAGDSHVPWGTVAAGAGMVLDVSNLGVGYEVDISTDETGWVTVPLPDGEV